VAYKSGGRASTFQYQPSGAIRSTTFSSGGGSGKGFRYGGDYSYNKWLPMMGSGPQQAGGQMGSALGGDMAGTSGHPVDQANPFVTNASQQFGVPTGVLKAIIVRESSGNWERDGNRFVDIGRPGTGPILPYVGIFSNAWDSWGCEGTAAQAVGNQQAQVDCLARGLAMWYQRAKATDPSYGWAEVASMHFAGHYKPTGWADENGMTDTQYVSNFMKDVQRFSGTGGTSSPGGLGGSFGGAAGGSAGIATVWGGQGQRDLSYGFLSPSGSNIYAYGRQYGLPSGNAHTGIDIPGAPNEPLYSPVAGRVVCACTGSGGGCASFNDVMHDGCGRIEVETANGHRIILGHSSRSTVRIGDMVSVGQQVGNMGGMNGTHVHLEYRIPDGSTNAGYRIVNPAEYLGGAAASGYLSGQQTQYSSGFGGPKTTNYWSGNARRGGYAGYWSGSR
jgi:murein DD-endopeptidase MepM/ murein hydrolase activator NlpD